MAQQLNVRLLPEEHAWAKAEAKRRRMSLSLLVSAALEQVRTQGLPEDNSEDSDNRYEDLERRLSRLEEMAGL